MVAQLAASVARVAAAINSAAEAALAHAHVLPLSVTIYATKLAMVVQRDIVTGLMGSGNGTKLLTSSVLDAVVVPAALDALTDAAAVNTTAILEVLGLPFPAPAPTPMSATVSMAGSLQSCRVGWPDGM
jgi:hypothetical protein